MDARFFIENGQIFALWFLISLAILIFWLSIEIIVEKIHKNKQRKNRKNARIKQEQKAKKDYIQKIRSSQQVKKVMSDDEI